MHICLHGEFVCVQCVWGGVNKYYPRESGYQLDSGWAQRGSRESYSEQLEGGEK